LHATAVRADDCTQRKQNECGKNTQPHDSTASRRSACASCKRNASARATRKLHE
jgi:hypothetical protein